MRRFEEVLVENADFVYLMEVSPNWDRRLKDLVDRYPYQKRICRSDYTGVAFLSKHEWDQVEVVDTGDANPPLEITFSRLDRHGDFRLIATHPLPPFGGPLTDSRDRQLVKLAERCHSSLPSLMVGDFNLTPWSPRFRRILQVGKLRDAALGFGVAPTLTPLPTLLGGMKVDHVLTHDDVAISDLRSEPSRYSDHCLVIVDFFYFAEKSVTLGIFARDFPLWQSLRIESRFVTRKRRDTMLKRGFTVRCQERIVMAKWSEFMAQVFCSSHSTRALVVQFSRSVWGWKPQPRRSFRAIAFVGLLIATNQYVVAELHETDAASNKRLLSIMDAIMENHVSPPTRQAMLHNGAKAVHRAAGTFLPTGLGQQISELASVDEFDSFLSSLRQDVKGKGKVHHKKTDLLFDELFTAGMLSGVSGGAEVVPFDEARVNDQFGGESVRWDWDSTGIQG